MYIIGKLSSIKIQLVRASVSPPPDIHKDEDKEEGDGITDLILAVVRLLREDINRLVKIVWEVLKLIKL